MSRIMTVQHDQPEGRTRSTNEQHSDSARKVNAPGNYF